jgi:hypothetical protein
VLKFAFGFEVNIILFLNFSVDFHLLCHIIFIYLAFWLNI